MNNTLFYAIIITAFAERKEVVNLICKVNIPFESEKNIEYNIRASSVMHGLLMEKISPDYARKMHDNISRPFSQYVRYENNRNIWTVSAIGKEACENIITPVLNLKTAYIKYKNDNISFGNPEKICFSFDDFLNKNYISDEKNITRKLDIITPAAFKSSGQYVILPTLRLIFLSIARKFDSVFGIENNNYEVLADEIEKNVSAVNYTLSGSSFSLEGIKIPSFTGNIKLKINGENDFKSYISMLCDLSQYSGIGIKTALGMGQVISEKL